MASQLLQRSKLRLLFVWEALLDPRQLCQTIKLARICVRCYLDKGLVPLPMIPCGSQFCSVLVVPTTNLHRNCQGLLKFSALFLAVSWETKFQSITSSVGERTTPKGTPSSSVVELDIKKMPELLTRTYLKLFIMVRIEGTRASACHENLSQRSCVYLSTPASITLEAENFGRSASKYHVYSITVCMYWLSVSITVSQPFQAITHNRIEVWYDEACSHVTRLAHLSSSS